MISPAPQAADLQLWNRFLSGRCTEHEIAGSLTLKRWARCRDAGLSADNPGEPVLSLAGLAEAIERFSPLVAPGAPFDAFATTIAKAGFCGILANSDGVIVSRHISEPFETTVVETALVEGAVWTEGARGTNGI